MDAALSALFFKTVDYLTDPTKLSYARYQAIASLKPDSQVHYENAERISKSLAFIIKTQLVKRIESSFFAFKSSLKTFQTANARMIAMFAKDQVFIAPDLNINKLMDNGLSDEEIAAEVDRLNIENPKNQHFKAEDFAPEFLPALENDALLLTELVEAWDAVDEDPKLTEFVARLSSDFLAPETNINGKLVIFSESKDTVNYLKLSLDKTGRNDVLVISSENRAEKYDTIVENFDANYPSQIDLQKGKRQKNDYNIIVTTEVLAEGVNLHRANVVVHYDTPWNSTKLMQRIGRVNRIGTTATQIYNYVFYPSAQGNAQIKLTKTALMKIQALLAACGEDNQIFSTDEIMDESMLFSGEYKEAEDERLKYLHELRQFKKDNQAWFDTIKKLPMKSRAGRASEASARPALANGTAAFLKTAHKLEFYWVQNDQPMEITPLEAFKYFKAEPEEQPAALLDAHHAQVKLALNHFEEVEQDYALERDEPAALGPKAQGVKRFLAELAKLPNATEQQQSHIKKLVALIEIGRFTKLPDKLDKILKSAKKGLLNPAAILVAVDHIAAEYNVKDHDVNKDISVKFTKPQLILSESFT
jgi:superfamily II DNA/RNA helicase